MADIRELMNKFGKLMVKAGATVGRKVADTYRKIDPDVMRHLSQTPLLVYSLFVSRREKIDPGEPDGYLPLIFVHGLGGSRGNFLLMSWYLWLAGRKRSYKIHFTEGQSIDDMATALARFIRDVKKATGEKRVEIIAHSLGGIIARLAISKHRLASSVKTLITLGTPHRGTYFARYANTKITRDLRPDSELMKRLNKRPWPKNIRGVSFWSRNDLLVLPAESAAMEGTEQVEVTPFTHYSYLIDPKSWAAVEKALMGKSRRTKK